MKKLVSILVALMLMTGMFGVVASAEDATEIYFLNFKPEVADIYEKIAADYEAETGVKVKVMTAAAGTYDQTFKSEVAKTDAPTIFQINGPVGYADKKDYIADMTDTGFYKLLNDKSLALTIDGKVMAVPYVVEGYGIIYNAAILNSYFASANKKTEYKSVDEINNFAALKAVVEDMTALKDELGIEGVFASTSMSTGEEWRWQTHLLNVPMYYEFSEVEGYDNTVLAGLNTPEVKFSYSDNFKNIVDLYTNNSTTDKALLSTKTVNDSMAEFALGKCAMVQNGNWGAGQILGVEGNVVKSEDIKFLPIYTGVEGEEKNGLCIGTENYLCINSQVSPEKQKASDDFLVWLFSSEKGLNYVKNDLKFIISPVANFADLSDVDDPLSKEVISWMSKEGVTSIPWTFACFPSQNFKDMVAASLLEYFQGSADWDAVKSAVVDNWAIEYQLANEK